MRSFVIDCLRRTHPLPRAVLTVSNNVS